MYSTEEHDEAMVDLGNAIRSGDAAYVFEIIETNNGIESSALSRRGLQFEITLRKQTKAELLTSNETEALRYNQDLAHRDNTERHCS